MKAIILLALCITIVLAATPARPNVPETYEANVKFDIENKTAFIHRDGNGIVARDYQANKALSHAFFDEKPPFIIYELARYDLGKEYFLDNKNWTQCHNESISGHLFPEWSWVSNATFAGTHNNVDIWNTTNVFNGYTFRIAAGFKSTGNSTAPSVPVFQVVETISGKTYERRTINYETFSTKVDDDDFAVPKQCGGTIVPGFLKFY